MRRRGVEAAAIIANRHAHARNAAACVAVYSARALSYYPKIDRQVGDISVGGLGDDAHKVSVPYRGIYRILRHRFGESIVRAPLHSGGSHPSHNHGLDHVTRC